MFAAATARALVNDFSGYTDIARGSALLLGVRLSNNFALPYLATSVIDFWHRWHMTLSSWLRDYLYKPLGGSRQSRSIKSGGDGADAAQAALDHLPGQRQAQ